MHDLSSKNRGLKPYSRARAEAAYHALKPGTSGAIAVVIRDGVVNRIVSPLYFRRRKEHGLNLEERLFTTRADALTWLQEQIKKSNTAKVSVVTS